MALTENCQQWAPSYLTRLLGFGMIHFELGLELRTELINQGLGDDVVAMGRRIMECYCLKVGNR